MSLEAVQAAPEGRKAGAILQDRLTMFFVGAKRGLSEVTAHPADLLQSFLKERIVKGIAVTSDVQVSGLKAMKNQVLTHSSMHSGQN